MIKNFKINDKDFQTILDLNEENGDSVIYLSGGVPLGSGVNGSFMSLEEKINEFWKSLGIQEGFDWETITIINKREFTAVATQPAIMNDYINKSIQEKIERKKK